MRRMIGAGVVLFVCVWAALAAEDKKAPSIGDLMELLHAEKTGTLEKIEKSAKADTPDWKEVQKLTGEYSKGATQLGKAAPPKADKKKLWADINKQLGTSAGKLDAGAKKKDAEAVTKSTKEIRGLCMKCHDAFRE